MDDMVAETKVLIVDDDLVNRKILESLLKRMGYTILLADHGEQAIEVFKSQRPGMVLMDIIMPGMNGYQAAKIIKSLSKDQFIPIIFLTAVTDEEALLKCVESGGDDFLTKPFNGIILKAKINALERIKSLYNALHKNRQELAHYRSSIEHELEFAEHILANITSKASIDLPYVKSWTSSLSPSDFSGDIFFAARKPTGGVHLMVCDFSGHGLPAAVGALPVSEIFLAMTNRGFSAYDILVEINKKLTNDLPTGFFCAAVFIDIDAAQGSVSVVNAGLPGCFVIDQACEEVRRIYSSQLPLGISIDSVCRESVEVMEVKEGLRLLVYTDGVSEVMNADGELYGSSHVLSCIQKKKVGQDLIESIQASVREFCGGREPSDDISVMELDCFAASQDMAEESTIVPKVEGVFAEWKVEFDLSISVLKSINPVPLILNAIRNLQLASDHRKRIFTILSELYTNALDHGLLKLDSSLKHSPDGFMRYHQEKKERLDRLSDGWAKIRVEHVVEDGEYVIKINVSDSGDGFIQEDSHLNEVVAESTLPSGRGIRLVKSMSDSLVYQDGGRVAEVKYLIQDVEVSHD